MPTHPNSDEPDLDYGPTLRGLRQGQVIFHQRYRLSRQIGRGGMGVVWLAQDSRLEREVALKFLPEAVQGDAVAVDELKRETLRCLELTHPNIVRIYDFEQEDNAAAIAMEYIQGHTLSQIRLQQPNRVFEAAEILGSLEAAIGALHYAHSERKVVHRDLKPANLMVDQEGRLKVADFGIASRIGDSFSRLSRGTGLALGTLAYMSPQQMLGFPPKVTDDVYALGATIYELLTGRPPFHSGSIERQIETVVAPSMAQRRKELEVQSDVEIPQAWEQTVAACLQKEADKRPQSALEVLQRLTGQSEPGTSGPATPGTEVSLPAPAQIIVQRKNSPWLKIAALLLLGGVVWAGYEFGVVLPAEKQAAAQKAAADQEAAQKLPAENTARLQKEKEEADRLAAERDVELKREQDAARDARNKQVALQAELDRKQREADQAEQQRVELEAQRRREENGKPKVLKVPANYSTVTAAMEAARPKDTVLVSPGIYEECVFLKSGVELRGVERDSTIIRNSSNLESRPLIVNNCDSGTVSNLTIEQKIRESGERRRSAVLIDGSTITLDNCRVNCLSSDGVWITGSGNSIVANCRVENCGSCGIDVTDNTGQPELQNNMCVSSQYGVYFGPHARGIASGNTCVGNRATGIVVDNDSNVNVVSNTCIESGHAGIYLDTGASGLIKGNTCDRNHDGICVKGSSTRVAIVDNRANANTGWGFAVEKVCVPRRFENNTGSGNKSGLVTRSATFN